MLKMNMLLLGIGTERLLFERMMVESCSGEVIIYCTDVREKICDSSRAVLLGFEPTKEAPAPIIPR